VVNVLPAARAEELIAEIARAPSRSIRQLAAATGVTRRTAARYRRIWRGTQASLAADELTPVIVAKADGPTAAALTREAARRGLPRSELVAEILSIIVSDGLLEIVLGSDDRVRAMAAAIGAAH
jgi:hypothetical protein